MKIPNVILCLLLMAFGCSPDSSQNLFEPLSERAGISFINELTYEEGFDVFRYRNYYNGGGVAIGDINNDGLSDIFFTSNQDKNKLFLNQGGLQFKDITETAGLLENKPWSTGVSMVDVNGDGWLDIYVCNSGDPQGKDRDNQLFINNKNGTFTDKATEIGLADGGFSTHSAFFDFDQDGDLDCYLLNNSFRPVSSLPIENTRDVRDTQGGDKFYRNDEGVFVDASAEVGVYGSVIGFGLGITLMDINGDTYTDIYVSNDFFERDYLYINQKGEYFTEELEQYFDQISVFSMGADAADLNNDGMEEFFVTDMLPEKMTRLKQTTSFDSYDLNALKKSKGFYHQYMKNSFQVNNGDGSFSELGRFSGVSATDWSWGSLIFDMDNDGYKEIFVTNGIYKDVTDQDFLAYFSSEENLKKAKGNVEEAFELFNEKMPSNPLSNYVFKRDSLLSYKNVAADWGLGRPGFSNGGAYGDLDNDGDLDLVVSHVNSPSEVFENKSNEAFNHNFIRLALTGERFNPFAIGAEVRVYSNNEVITYHHYPTRGFQSSMDYSISIGLGTRTLIDSLEIIWDADRRTISQAVEMNKLHEYNIADANSSPVVNKKAGLFNFEGPGFAHTESPFIDFDRERLIYHKLSIEGPVVVDGDIDGDGLSDIYLGGSRGYPGQIFLNKGGRFEGSIIFEEDVLFEDTDAEFFDADGDGDLDLYVVSGSNEASGQREYYDRLYINNSARGNVTFEKRDVQMAPEMGSCVDAADYDNDGDIDLFVGSRGIPGQYGKPGSSAILENDGLGNFKDVSPTMANHLRNIGMVTDAEWMDYDGDGDDDILIVGDFMPLTILENRGDFFRRKFELPGLENSNGWWRSVKTLDLNGDGLQDFIAGNLGLNSRFKATVEDPIRLYFGDVDNNGMLDQIFTFSEGGKFFPYHLRNDLAMQLVEVKKKFPSFEGYADKAITEIFNPEQLASTATLDAEILYSVYGINDGEGGFIVKPLPYECQVSPIFEINELGIGGVEHILLTGNFDGTRPEEGIYDANHGILIKYEDGEFKVIPQATTGLKIRGDVRSVNVVEGNEGKLLIVGKNDDNAEIYSFE